MKGIEWGFLHNVLIKNCKIIFQEKFNLDFLNCHNLVLV